MFDVIGVRNVLIIKLGSVMTLARSPREQDDVIVCAPLISCDTWTGIATMQGGGGIAYGEVSLIVTFSTRTTCASLPPSLRPLSV